jgi:hypothetical protein
VSKWNDGFVSFRGTKHVEGEPVKGALKTSLVECYQQEKYCAESIGEISGGYLSLAAVRHTIRSWDDQSITFVDANACKEDVFKINRSAQLPIGQRTPKSDADRNCSDAEKQTVRVMFSDSSAIWQAERAKSSIRTEANIALLLLFVWVIYRVWVTFKEPAST